jgi:hypothetical protein
VGGKAHQGNGRARVNEGTECVPDSLAKGLDPCQLAPLSSLQMDGSPAAPGTFARWRKAT